MQLDDIFGVHARALVLRGQRTRLLATNLANADTPGYQSRDVDFDELLRSESARTMPLAITASTHLSLPEQSFGDADLMYRVPNQPALDGNTVDPQIEQAEFAKNEMRYETSLRFLNGRISSLLLAIRGE